MVPVVLERAKALPDPPVGASQEAPSRWRSPAADARLRTGRIGWSPSGKGSPSRALIGENRREAVEGRSGCLTLRRDKE